MPIHDWTRVDAGIFHDFHLHWIARMSDALNQGLLPSDYYALAEQHAGKLEPDVLTLRGLKDDGSNARDEPLSTPDDNGGGGVGLKLAPPRASLRAETDLEFYRRKQRVIAVRHVSGDNVVAIIEIVSRGNKDSRHALTQFVEKAVWFLDRQVHLLIIDLQPPTVRDPNSIHGAIWDEIGDQPFQAPLGKPLTAVSYERDESIRAYIEPLAVGDPLPDMPLFLIPGGHVLVPLEETYQKAWSSVPRRWREVIEPA